MSAQESWEHYHEQSLRPGGFGEERAKIWPTLLFVQGNSRTTIEEEHEEVEEHKDERQIQLDTDRSFVMYPNPVKTDRETLQEELRKLLVALFRKRPKLQYFQGYHDIVTVLFLTLPEDIRLACIEQLSLHRLRDSMGASLEPVLGLLRFMKELLRAIDPEYAATLEENTPLPSFALSNLLTLFAHDIPTLPLIQHVFDFLLCRPPVMVVYLVVAVTLARKAEVKRLRDEGDDGMLHSLLASLPNLTDAAEGVDGITLNVDTDIKTEQDEEKQWDEKAEVEEQIEPDSRKNVQEEVVNLKEEQKDEDDTRQDDERPSSPEDESLSTTEIKPVDGDHELQDASEPEPEPENLNLKPTISLTTLLETADSLFERYPPEKHKLSEIMGPQSVVFTWSEIRSELPSDDTAERMVEYPQLVVYPAVPDVEEDEDEPEVWEVKERQKYRNMKARELREKKAMVVGAVLVLGVAMLVYGTRNTAGIGGGRAEWKRIGGWVGSVLSGFGLGSRYW